MKNKLVIVGAIMAAALSGCENATRTQREAGAGAAAGAIIGGIIGSHSGDAVEGAAVGAAAGGALGAAHGSGEEARERRNGAYTAEDYRRLLTEDEVEILRARARASGDPDERLTDFLTDQEKENLRRRDRARNHEIGS